MRFLRLFAISALCLTLCACRGGGGGDGVGLAKRSGNYSATASISYKDLQAEATFTRESPQSCSVAFTSPESLKDMSFVFWQDKIDLSYKGMSFTFDPSSIPGNALANIAVSAINSAMKDDGLEVEYSEDTLTLNGVMKSGRFTLRLDKQSGNLLKLSVPSEELEIEFLNFTFLD